MVHRKTESVPADSLGFTTHLNPPLDFRSRSSCVSERKSQCMSGKGGGRGEGVRVEGGEEGGEGER